MGLGQWSCYLKTPLQTFDTATAVTLIAPHLRIIFSHGFTLAGWGLGGGRGVCRVGGRNLIFKLKRTE